MKYLDMDDLYYLFDYESLEQRKAWGTISALPMPLMSPFHTSKINIIAEIPDDV